VFVQFPFYSLIISLSLLFVPSFAKFKLAFFHFLHSVESPTIDLYLKQINEARRIEKNNFRKYVYCIGAGCHASVSFMVGNEGQDARLLANAQVLNVNAQPSDSALQGNPLTKRVCQCVYPSLYSVMNTSLFGSSASCSYDKETSLL
jgi:hypothetical protein